MKFLVIACVLAVVAAAPQKDYRNIQVLRDDRDVRPDGYSFAYETDDGVKRTEEGRALSPSGALATSGSIEFTFPDGQVYVLNYVADENGYRPESEFIPKAGRK